MHRSPLSLEAHEDAMVACGTRVEEHSDTSVSFLSRDTRLCATRVDRGTFRTISVVRDTLVSMAAGFEERASVGFVTHRGKRRSSDKEQVLFLSLFEQIRWTGGSDRVRQRKRV